MSPLVIGPQNKRRHYYLSAAALLVVFGVAKLSLGGLRGDLDTIFVVAMILGGASWGIWTIATLRRRGNAVVMDNSGVTIRVPDVGLVEWDDIAAVRTDIVRSRGYLHIVLRDPAAALAREPSLERYIADAEVWFDASEIDMSPRELANAIIERRNVARRL